MASITITATQSKSTTQQTLSAFGPNVTLDYGTISLTTVQPVTATVLGVSLNDPQPYSNEPALFTFTPSWTSPALISSSLNTLTGLLSAAVGAGALGTYSGSINLTLSAFCLSGAGPTLVPVDNTTVTVSLSTMSLTAVNIPYAGRLCYDQFRRLIALGCM